MPIKKIGSVCYNSIIKRSSKVGDLFSSEDYKSYSNRGLDLERIIKTAVLASDPSESVIDSENRVYFRNRAISAGGEYDIQYLNPKKAFAQELHRYYGANDNYDYFPASELKSDKEGEGYKSFVIPVQASRCVNHDYAEDGSKSIGKVIAAYYNDLPYPEGQYVELISYVDKKLAHKLYPGILEAIEGDLLTDTSMGVWCNKSICSVCNNVAEDPKDFCSHVKEKYASARRGYDVYEINLGLKFFEDSFIGDPSLWDGSYRVYNIPFNSHVSTVSNAAGADPNAKILQVIAKKKEEGIINKAASYIKEGILYLPENIEEIGLVDVDTGKETVVKIKGLKKRADDLTTRDLNRISEGDYVELKNEPIEYRKKLEEERKNKELDFKKRKKSIDILEKKKPLVVFKSDKLDFDEKDEEDDSNFVIFRSLNKNSRKLSNRKLKSNRNRREAFANINFNIKENL